AEVHAWLCWLMVAVGASVFLFELILRARAPYGRYASLSASRWYGPPIDPRFAWAFQESWSFTVPLVLLKFAREACLQSSCNQILLAMFVGHYANRTFIYSFRLRSGSRMPIGICLLAAAFCAFNGLVQGLTWTMLVERKIESLLDGVLFFVGCSIWGVGLAINYHSDGVLRSLRRPGDTRYKIPRGGAFELVSCANYLGEIIEWTGYAIAARTFGAFAFAFFTFANTGPRAHHHHQWYLKHFDDYPKSRRALIPWIW
ncbi:MAG: hypothetical protein SGPRY_013277, partial [Prymnesium sp.]